MSELTIPSGISFEPSDDERMMIDSVRRYCENEIKAIDAKYGESFIPTEEMRGILKKLTELGFVSGPISVEIRTGGSKRRSAPGNPSLSSPRGTKPAVHP